MLIASRQEIGRLLGRLEVRTWQPLAWIAVGAGLATLVSMLPEYAGLPPAGRWALFILLFAAGLWITEAIPAFAVGLLVISLEVAILGRVGGPFADDPDDWKIFIEPWGSPLIWLFFGGFVLARGIQRSGLDLALSLRVLHRFGSRPSSLLFGAMSVTFAFSMFASNTATCAMMLAVIGPVVASRKDDPFARALLLGVAFGANIGGMATIIGTPPNAIAAGSLASVDPVGFARWLTVGFPPACVLLVVAWRFLLHRFPSHAVAIDLDVLQRPSDVPVMPRWRRMVVGTTVLATVALWLTEPLHGAPPPVVAFVPVGAFALAKVLTSEDIRRLEWDVLLLLAGGLALGVAVAETGLAAWLVAQLPVDATSPAMLAFVLALATVTLSNFMSNTAAANIVIPMGLALAPGHEASVAVAIALAASAAMCLPVSTPPNALAYSAGVLGTRDFISGGLVIGVLGVALVVGWSLLVL
jgi:sodium-dependent dicarboxylate transporter 2/3/5